jgi:hypothetical protein
MAHSDGAQTHVRKAAPILLRNRPVFDVDLLRRGQSHRLPQERMALQTSEQTPEGPVPDHVPLPVDRLNRPVPMGDARASHCGHPDLS